MTEFEDEPPWELLPYDPHGFFGLKGGFDLKDLKRRYTQLIKRYKPEKHPTEFQKIRAAYESVETRLRYQPPTSSDVLFMEMANESMVAFGMRDFEAPTSGDESFEDMSESSGNTSAPLSAQTLLERVKLTSPEDLHRELKSQKGLTQDERLLLAFLDDAGAGEHENDFFDSLMMAAQNKRGGAAWNVLFEYLRSEQARSRCADYLPRLFALLGDEEVYTLADPLWIELQRRSSFNDFLGVLNDCLDRVKAYHSPGYLMFNLRLIKQTLFYAPLEWIIEKSNLFQSSAIEWPNWLDGYVQHVKQLIYYMMDRKRFLNGNALRARIDELIQAYCIDAPDFELRLTNLQVELLENFGALDQAFPRSDKSVAVAWEVWQYICNQAAPDDEDPGLPTLEQSLVVLDRLSPQFRWLCRPFFVGPWQWDFWTNPIAPWVYPLPLAINLLITIATAPEYRLNIFLVFGPGSALVTAIMYFIAGAGVATPDTWFTRKSYRLKVRSFLIRFVRLFPVPARDLHSRLQTIADFSEHRKTVLAEAQNDFALQFYTTAAWHLR